MFAYTLLSHAFVITTDNKNNVVRFIWEIEAINVKSPAPKKLASRSLACSLFP